jgi:hypothetical protein
VYVGREFTPFTRDNKFILQYWGSFVLRGGSTHTLDTFL